MTTYNTGNPIGSTDARDLYDNAQNLDNFANGTAASYTDRLGVSRRSLAGIDSAADNVLNSIGYTVPVAYASGISLTLTSQTVEYNGVVYAPLSSALPFTTSSWGTDSAKFRAVQVTDADLITYNPAGTDVNVTDVESKLREFVSVNDFIGADPTGVTDSTAAINNAAAQALATSAVLRAQGTFKISGAVNLRNVRVDFSSAVLVLDAGATSLVIGGSSSTTINPRQDFKRVYRSGGATATPTLLVAGTKNQTFYIGACDYLQLYADTSAPNSATNGSIAYCTFNLGKIDKLEVTNNPANAGGPATAGDGGTIQWINENRFNLQRCAEFVMSGTYEHNHNVIIGGTFESTSTITITNGWDNHFYDLRFEGTPTVTFGATTQRNVIINTWDSSTSNFDASATVVDNGFDNLVFDDFFLYRNAQTIAYTDVSDVVINTQTAPIPARNAYLSKIYGTGSTNNLVYSDLAPVSAGDYFRFVTVDATGSIASSTCKYRPRIEFYDAQLRPVTAATDFILTTGGALSLATGNAIVSGADQNGAVAVILPAAIAAGVHFVRCSWRNGSLANANATQLFVTHLTRRGSYKGFGVMRNSNRSGDGVLVSGIPTQGNAPAGYTAIKSDATAKYVNRFYNITTTTAGHSAGATAIAVTAVGGVATGDIVGVNLDDGTTHWTTVAAGSTSTSINLTVGLPSNSATNSVVVFNRWTTY